MQLSIKDNSDFLHKKITISFLAFALITLVLFFEPKGTIGLVSVFLILFNSIYILYYSLKLFRLLSIPTKKYPFLIGTFVILGGALIDIVVTIIYSPDLKEEGNPIILTLLNLDWPLWSIYLFCALLQIVILSYTLILWANFIKMYPSMIRSIPYKNLFTTYKWLSGAGQQKNFLDVLLNRKFDYTFFMFTIMFLLVLMHINRWYFAMEWIKLVPASNKIPIIINCFIILLFLIKAHKQVQRLSSTAVISK